MAQVYTQTGVDENGSPTYEFVDVPDTFTNTQDLKGSDIAYAGGSNTFDESAGVLNPSDNSDLGGSPPVAIGGTIYTQNPDGSWDGADGSTFTDTDFQNYKDSTIAIGDTGAPGAGGTVGGVTVPPGLTPVGSGGGSGGDTWDKIATALKLKNPDGSYDWAKLLAATGVGVSAIGSMTQTPEKQKTIAELRAGMPAMNATQSFTPETLAMMQRPMQTGSALQRVYAADMQQPFAKGQTTKGYADGGEVMPGEMQEMPGALSQAFAGAVQGDEGGQSDLVDAKLSPGEYVLDAETVSALGDGNTAAGIAKLDELRAKLREQKRSAPTQDIPPQAQGPLSYMQGA